MCFCLQEIVTGSVKRWGKKNEDGEEYKARLVVGAWLFLWFFLFFFALWDGCCFSNGWFLIGSSCYQFSKIVHPHGSHFHILFFYMVYVFSTAYGNGHGLPPYILTLYLYLSAPCHFLAQNFVCLFPWLHRSYLLWTFMSSISSTTIREVLFRVIIYKITRTIPLQILINWSSINEPLKFGWKSSCLVDTDIFLLLMLQKNVWLSIWAI